MTVLHGNTLLERRWLLFLLIALLFRGLYVSFQISEIRHPDTPGRLSVTAGDTPNYLIPVEHLIEHGSYSPDYRMPGVGAPYWLFRQFFDVGGSRDAMVVLMWFLSGISVYLLSLIALRLSGSHTTALVVYALFLLSSNTSWYDTSISSDSLAVSAIIIHIYLLQRAVDRKSYGALALSGLFLTWLVFLRPVATAMLLPAPILVYLYWDRTVALRALLIFLLPFLLIDGAWIVRNWRVNGAFSPLTNQGLMPDEIAKRTRGYVMRFIQAYGGNYIWWQPGSDIRWYGTWDWGGELDNEGRDAKEPPAHAYVPGYTRDSLVALSERIRLLGSGTLSASDSTAGTASINATLERYTELYKQEAPFNYHVLSRLRMLKNVSFQNGTESMFTTPFGSLPLWMKLFKLFQSFLYVFAYTVGAATVVMMLLKWRPGAQLLAAWVPMVTAYTVLVYPLVLRMCEWRYMVHVFPLALMLATITGMGWLTRVRRRPVELGNG